MKHVLCAVLSMAALGAASTSAHHSYSAYDRDTVIEIDGVLEEFVWAAPHSLLKVRAGERLYTFEWQGTSSLRRRGLRSDFFTAGDLLVVTGNPRRDIAASGFVALRSVRRPADGWSWGVQLSAAPPAGSKR